MLGSRLSTLRSRLLRCRLAGLAADLFAVVPDSFAFVWFGLANRSHFGGEFADELLIGALDHNMGLVGTRNGKFRGDLLVHFVREADPQLKRVALDSAEVADALDLKFLF